MATTFTIGPNDRHFLVREWDDLTHDEKNTARTFLLRAEEALDTEKYGILEDQLYEIIHLLTWLSSGEIGSMSARDYAEILTSVLPDDDPQNDALDYCK